jgi:hypothetical protein
MYGMINEAIRSMVIEKFDVIAWEEIVADCGLNYNTFKSFEQYDDSITGDLVASISKKTKVEPIIILEDFGRHWIKFASNSEYSSILDAFATSPVDLIRSLDGLHTRLQITFDNLKSPSFWVDRINDNKIIVYYSSQRELPLEFFVIGLIHGIFGLFDQVCEVKLIPSPDKEKGVFEVLF